MSGHFGALSSGDGEEWNNSTEKYGYKYTKELETARMQTVWNDREFSRPPYFRRGCMRRRWAKY